MTTSLGVFIIAVIAIISLLAWGRLVMSVLKYSNSAKAHAEAAKQYLSAIMIIQQTTAQQKKDAEEFVESIHEKTANILELVEREKK